MAFSRNKIVGFKYTDTTLGNMWNDFKTELDIMMGAKYEDRGQRKKKYIVLSVVAEDLVPYCLRHTYCTDLEAAGVPINVAARLMGHANIQLTSKIYTHRSEVAFESAATAIHLKPKKAAKSSIADEAKCKLQ